MKKTIFLIPLLVLSFYSCSEKGMKEREVIDNYANIVYNSYFDSYNAALELQKSIRNLINSPSEEGLEIAKKNWLNARYIYGQTEVYRETNGPIDVRKSELAPWGIANEAQMNAWPIDESYVDYALEGTESHAGAYNGVITDTTVTITQELLIDLNEKDTDKSISTGWHVIEFLLWGQDLTPPEDNKAGLREYTDYTSAPFAQRRGQYLNLVTDLLVTDLKKLVDTWSEGGTYRSHLKSLEPDLAIAQIVNGMFFLSGDELSSERLIAPVDSTDGFNESGQEDEHSCFSDNTHQDVYANMLGINNVLFGTYGSISGPSFYDLVKKVDVDQAKQLKEAADKAMESVLVIAENPKPFDYLITQESSSDDEFGPIMKSVVALQDLSDQITISGNLIGVKLN
ncbi:MAG: imelysin family protein [Bacteroidota bacterium]